MRFKNFFIFLLLGILATNLFYGAYLKSLITDEPTHLAAGLSYLKNLKFSINPEHPPLMKLLGATIPYFSGKIVLPQENIKSYFDLCMFIVRSIRLNCSYIDFLTLTARFFPTFFTMLLGFLIYRIAKGFYGEIGGLAALLLFCFEPTFLGHGKLLHTDVGATLFYLLYFYALYRIYLSPCLFGFILLSIVLGLSLITKFSMLILVPIHFFVMIFILFKREWRKFRMALPLMVSIPWFIVCAGYFFKISMISEAEIKFIAKWFFLPFNSLQFIKYLPIYLPPDFIKGIDVVFEHNHMGHWSYLLGQYSKTGWWYYFPIALCLKESLPILIVFFLGLVYCLFKIPKDKKNVFIIFPIFYYSIFAFTSHVNIGIRHYLPVFPFLIIGGGGVMGNFFNKNLWLRLAILVLLFLAAFEGIRTFPHYIGYFNPLAGGFEQGWKRLSDSNVEWGQDIKSLADFCHKKGIKSLEVYAFNFYLLPCYGIKIRLFSPLRNYFLETMGDKRVLFLEGNKKRECIKPHYVAIGSSWLILPPYALVPGMTPKWAQEIEKRVSQFRSEKPWAVVGKTIFVYKYNEVKTH